MWYSCNLHRECHKTKPDISESMIDDYFSCSAVNLQFPHSDTAPLKAFFSSSAFAASTPARDINCVGFGKLNREPYYNLT